MTRLVAAAFVLLTVAGLAVSPALTTANAGPAPLATPEGFSQTVFTIEVTDDGTARWTFEYSRPLDNASERDQFRAFAEEFEENESAMYLDFVDRAHALTDAGTDATGRSMNASGFSRSAEVDEFSGARGVVELSFDWENFAVVDGDTVRVGDVFDGGLYVGDDQRLVIEAGPSLAIAEARPDSYTESGRTLQSSSSVTWIGEQQFADEHPSVTLRPESAVGDDSETTSDEERTTAATARSNGDMLVLVGVLVVVFGLVGAAVWQSGALSRGREVTEDSAADAAGAAAEASGATGEQAGIPDEELLSDDDRVIKLLEENGGRMKQVKIVDQTEWSKSKVSMLLSEMEDEGQISKLRVGRENIISLTGHEPDAAGSPFDDE